MRGWTPDGAEIELLPWQEEMVRRWMEYRDAGIGHLIMPSRGRMGGKSVVTATITRLDQNKTETGEWFPDE